jgi:hypothetical protein
MNGRRHSVLWPIPAIAATFFSTGAHADNFGTTAPRFFYTLTIPG